MIWENGIETCIISYKKRIASLGSMQDTGYLGLVHWDDPERWCGEGGGSGVQDWEHVYTRDGFMLIYGKTNCWWECKLVQPLWRTVWRFLKNLQTELPYDPAIPLLGIYTEETRIERVTCTPVFITAWKQPRCPSADEWIRKLWYIYTMEYYSAIKKNAFESVLMKWMKLEPIIQSEVSQKEYLAFSI